MAEACVRLSDSQLAKWLGEQKDKVVLLDFYADWCPHCQKVGPLLEDLARENKKGLAVAKIDADEIDDTTASHYKVEVLPTILLLKGGKQVERITGSREKKFFEELVKKYLSE